MQSYFNLLADHLTSLLSGEEVYTSQFGGEDSDFVRFNHAQVRQAGQRFMRRLMNATANGRRFAERSLDASRDSR